jgi:hypothetical protein
VLLAEKIDVVHRASNGTGAVEFRRYGHAPTS